MNTIADQLLKASEIGATRAVIELCKFGAPVNKADKDGFTPLMFAASCGDVKMIRALLDAGANVNAEASEGWYEGETALIVAARNGHEEAVAELLKRGANVNAKRKNVRFAGQLERARAEREEKQRREEEKRKKLGQTGNEFQCEQYVKTFDPFEWAEEHLAERRGGYTPLMFAAALDHEGIVGKLLAHGADAGAQDDLGKTALTIARENKSRNAANMLSQFAAPISAKEKQAPPPTAFPLAPRGMTPTATLPL